MQTSRMGKYNYKAELGRHCERNTNRIPWKFQENSISYCWELEQESWRKMDFERLVYLWQLEMSEGCWVSQEKEMVWQWERAG